MDFTRLEQALRQLPRDTLLTEIPEVQNSIAHLLKSNEAMREYDPERNDPDLCLAITENEALIQRYEKRIDLTLQVIRDRLGEAAAREVRSNVDAFRRQHPTEVVQHQNNQSKESNEGVFL